MTVRTWRWQGLDDTGRQRSGLTPGPDIAHLHRHLRRRGILLLHAAPLPGYLEWLMAQSHPRLNPRQRAEFFRQLATLVAADVPLVQALEMIAREERGALRPMVGHIRDDVAAGRPLHAALAEYPRFFDALTCSLVRAGEQASALATMLERIASSGEREEAIRRRLRRAMLYPAVVLGIAALVTLALLGFVVPRFESMFAGFGTELPRLTRHLIAASAWLRAGGWMLVILAATLAPALIVLSRYSPALRRRRDRLLLRLPIIGELLARALETHFTRTLAIMIGAGLPLAEALPTLAQTMRNTVYRRAVEHIAEAIGDGRSLENAISSTGRFSETLTQMVAVGEETGRLEAMLGRVARLTEEQVSQRVDGLGAMLEPALMVLLGLAIGGLVLALYLPVFQLGNMA